MDIKKYFKVFTDDTPSEYEKNFNNLQWRVEWGTYRIMSGKLFENQKKSFERNLYNSTDFYPKNYPYTFVAVMFSAYERYTTDIKKSLSFDFVEWFKRNYN